MPTSHTDTRREFLKRLIKGGLAFLALIFGIVSLRFLYPSKIKSRDIRFYYILKEEELPGKGVKKIELSYEKGQRNVTLRAFLVNSNGAVFALSPVCTHLGCLVDWSAHKSAFLCPCHGGKYDIEGRVVAGPPPEPLTRLPLKIEDGKVYVGIKI